MVMGQKKTKVYKLCFLSELVLYTSLPQVSVGSKHKINTNKSGQQNNN